MFCVLVISHHCQLEKSWPPRALACPQLRIEAVNTTLHDICTTLGDELTRCLPTLHALTGCDTTSKVSTKLAALRNVSKPENSSRICNFDGPQLAESEIETGLSSLTV